jgi:hypothetical protein
MIKKLIHSWKLPTEIIEQLKHFPFSTCSTMIINEKIKDLLLQITSWSICLLKENDKKKQSETNNFPFYIFPCPSLSFCLLLSFLLSRSFTCPFFIDIKMHDFDENIIKSHKEIDEEIPGRSRVMFWKISLSWLIYIAIKKIRNDRLFTL